MDELIRANFRGGVFTVTYNLINVAPEVDWSFGVIRPDLLHDAAWDGEEIR